MPLSHAICCRPCLPKALPGSTSNDTALAVVSLGCHASSNPGSASLRCESQGGSLVSGAAFHNCSVSFFSFRTDLYLMNEYVYFKATTLAVDAG